MKVEGILKAKGSLVETVPAQTRVSAVIQKIVTKGIGAVVVSEDGIRVEGMISERDIVKGLKTYPERLLEMSAREIMSRGVPVCSPDDTIQQVMSQMTRTRNRHLPVVSDGKLCGIVSLGDVVKKRLEDMELETSVLRDAYIAGH